MTVADYAKEIYDLIDSKEYTHEEALNNCKKFFTDLEKTKGMGFSIEVTKKLCELIQSEGKLMG